MKMDPDDVTRFKKFHQYVSVAIPEVRKMPFIIQTIMDVSGNCSEKKVKDGLIWNEGPIKIVPGLICAGDPAAGCYAPDSNVIRIKEEWVKEFNAGGGIKHTAFCKLVYFVGVTLLHEYCHWANDGTGKPDQTHAKFEQRLYGKVIYSKDR